MTELSFQISGNPTTTNVTLPSEQLCHYITDSELDGLGDMKKEPVAEIFLATIGVFLGGLIPALQVLKQFSIDATKVGIFDLLTVMIAGCALAVAFVTGFLWRQRSKTHKGLVETIRGRQRVPMRLAVNNDGA